MQPRNYNLGLVLTDTLDYSVTAKHIAQSASRSLGLPISKYKALCGMDYEVFTKLYDTMVWSTITYELQYGEYRNSHV